MPSTPDRAGSDALSAAADFYTWNWEDPGTILATADTPDLPGASDAFLSMPNDEAPRPSNGSQILFPAELEQDEAFLPEIENGEPFLYASEVPSDPGGEGGEAEAVKAEERLLAPPAPVPSPADPLLISLLMSSDVAGLIKEKETVRLPPPSREEVARPNDEPVLSWQQLEELAAPEPKAPAPADEPQEAIAEVEDAAEEGERCPWRAWTAFLLVGLLGGAVLTVGLHLAVGRGTVPPPETVAASPAVIATLPPAAPAVASLAPVVPATPAATPVTAASAPPVFIPRLADPASQRRQLRERLEQGVQVGRQDPFVITAPFLQRPTSKPIVPYNPVPLFPGPVAPGAAMAQVETLELRLTGIMPGPQPLALVEGSYRGQPFKVWARPGQSLGYGLRAGAVGASSLEVRQPHSRFALTLGKPVTLRRAIAP